jgi:hypothetical protein
MVSFDHREDFVDCFQADAHGLELELDQGEIADAQWFPRNRLPDDLGRYARPILARSFAPRS